MGGKCYSKILVKHEQEQLKKVFDQAILFLE